MPEEKRSLLYKLKPIVDRIPAVAKPEGHVTFKSKMLWSTIILITYFAMTNVMIYGISGKSQDMFGQFRAIMAGANGSLMHLGIGPIVTGSIIMQLFTGAKIINLDLSNDQDKALYQNTQKLVVMIMILVEAIPQVFGYLTPADSFVSGLSSIAGTSAKGLANALIVFQLFIGSYLVFLMDEVVSKWGLGSGISLFIAAGVSQATVQGTVNWLPVDSSSPLTIGDRVTAANLPTGTIPKIIYIMQNQSLSQMTSSGYERIMLQQPNPVIAVIGTVTIFFIVAYAESMRIELPLAHGRARGARGRYPIRLIYASNIPVILMAALLANINMFSLLFWSRPPLNKIPIIGHAWWIGAFAAGQTKPYAGGAWYLSSVRGVGDWLLPLMSWSKYGQYTYGHAYWQVVAKLIIYLVVMILGSVMFAKFWIETTNMGPSAVAKQIRSSGMHIPGFRRDPRILERVLERYIPRVTVISGAFVGALAACANMIGTVGSTSGTGVLLTVGILIRLYEQIAKEQMAEMHPVVRDFLGLEG